MTELDLSAISNLGEENLQKLIHNASGDGRDFLLRTALSVAAREDSPKGFRAFYELIYGNQLPDHLNAFIEQIYESKKQDRANLFFAFRGSWKTTTISMAFTAFRIGQNPERANLIIQASDSSAKKCARAIAEIIEFNKGFKMVFPNVVPDKDKAWGDNSGYDVKRADLDYRAWREMNQTRKDPTLLGLGILSTELIGKHPDGVMLLDDIHDEDNTKSDVMRQGVIKKLTGTVLPMAVEDITREEGQRLVTWEIAVGTPWNEDDAYHHMKNTGEFDFMEMPVMTPCGEEDPGAVYFNHLDLTGYYRLNWPDRFDEKVIRSWRNKSGKVEFARMYLLDLSMANLTGFKYISYPSELIAPSWFHNGAVDFASIRDRANSTNNTRDYFAMAWGCKPPAGGFVIDGGDFGHKTQAEGEALIERIQATFPSYGTTVIEDDGKGESFVDVLLRKPHLRITPMLTRGVAKRTRQEKMAAWFEIGIVRISDADTPFLNALRKAFDEYPGGGKGADDIRDAVYWLCRSVPEVLMVPESEVDLPEVVIPGETSKPKNPFAAFGRK